MKRDIKYNINIKKSLLFFLIIFIIILFISCPIKESCLVIVVIPDLNLEAVIREEINKPSGDIYLHDVENITSLYAIMRNIFDLTGIENLTSLTDLIIYNNNISDITPLSTLTSINRLNLSGNNISDINSLSRFTALTKLGVDRNNISDISPLVANSGINSGDIVILEYNPLNAESINKYIPALEARGVNVIY